MSHRWDFHSMQKQIYFHYVWQKRRQQQFRKIRIVVQEVMKDDEKAILRIHHVVMDLETMVQDVMVQDVMDQDVMDQDVTVQVATVQDVMVQDATDLEGMDHKLVEANDVSMDHLLDKETRLVVEEVVLVVVVQP